MDDNIIHIENLCKNFGDVKAVDGISFDVKRGSLFAFLGLNGAGKSTTINIICSIIKKSSGKVFVDGNDIDVSPDEIKRITGIVFQQSVLDARLSVKDNLKCRAALYGITGAKFKVVLDRLTQLLSLQDILGRAYGKLSGGQKRRADIARGLLNEPKLLILDEPTTGLDPQTRKSVWSVIDELRRERDMTVFLTTHYMEESNGADEVIILDSGRIVASGSPLQLKNLYSGTYIKIYTAQDEASRIKISEILKNSKVEYCGNCYKVKISDIDDIKCWVNNCPPNLDDYEIIKGDMDDVFLNVTGKTLTGGAL